MTSSETTTAENSRKSAFPRILLLLFALGSMATVFGVGLVSKRNWQEFMTAARSELAHYPVIEERLGEITEIHLDKYATETHASASNSTGNQIALELRGTFDIGRLNVFVVERGKSFELTFGPELRLSGDTIVPMVRGSSPDRPGG